MNQFDKNDPMEKLLREAADQINPESMFVSQLEKKLTSAHAPKAVSAFLSVKKVASTAGWVIGWAVITLMFIWVARSIAPQPQPAAANTPVPITETVTPESLTLEKSFNYIVQPNDTCSFLADKFGVTVEDIVAFNGLTDSCVLFTDQLLYIPIKGTNQTAEGSVYNWNGTMLYLNAPFPETPAEMNIYLARDEVRATAEDTIALAAEFGMSGEVYQVPGELVGTTDFLVVDGNRHLRVRSDRYFTYYPSYADALKTAFTGEDINAETLINEFMQSHGFNFNYKIEYSEFFGAYFVLPLTPDGFVLHHEHFSFGGMSFELDQNGIVRVNASLLKYGEAATVGVISAQEAFQRLVDPTRIHGVEMGMHSASVVVDAWVRTHPLDEIIVYYGFLSSTGRSITGAAPLITLDGYTVTGNVSEISENMPNTFIEAMGKFHESDGIKTFELESWKAHEGYEEGYQGTIDRAGEQVFMDAIEAGRILLVDAPVDLPLPAENMYMTGVTRDDVFEWKNIDNRMQAGGGGGGGGGSGFYKLNLSGTPVPLPTPAPLDETLSVDEAFTAAPLDGVRGMFTVSIFQQADGSARHQYNLVIKNTDYDYGYIQLEGDSLQSLESHHNRPVTIWGTPDRINEQGALVVNVERYEVPFPDLQFQIVRGTQKQAVVQDQPVILFTAENGATYVELYVIGDLNASIVGVEGDPILNEVLIIPDETFGGYPTMRVFSSAMAVNPKNGGETELAITADQPYIVDESVSTDDFTPPDAIVEKIELVYFTLNQRYMTPDANTEPSYLQPVWRFSGHYTNGDEFEIFIQALKDEFLLPEIQSLPSPG